MLTGIACAVHSDGTAVRRAGGKPVALRTALRVGRDARANARHLPDPAHRRAHHAHGRARTSPGETRRCPGTGAP
jgi:hypothetical protein